MKFLKVLLTVAVVVPAVVAHSAFRRIATVEQQILQARGIGEEDAYLKARIADAKHFPYHQEPVHGKDFKEAVLLYSHHNPNAKMGNGANTRELVKEFIAEAFGKKHDYGYREAVEANGFAVKPCFDANGDPRPPQAAVKAKAAHQGERMLEPAKLNLGPRAKEDFGQLHEVYSAFAALVHVANTPSLQSFAESNPERVVAGLLTIAGTLGAGFGKFCGFGDNALPPPCKHINAQDRIKVLHEGLILMDTHRLELGGKMKIPSLYSAKGFFKDAFVKMHALSTTIITCVRDATALLEKKEDKVAELTLIQWFDAGEVGDFLYFQLAGSLCKSTNCFGEFYQYGGMWKGSKGGVGCKAAGGSEPWPKKNIGEAGCNPFAPYIFAKKKKCGPCNDLTQSWKAFWLGQPDFIGAMGHQANKLGLSNRNKAPYERRAAALIEAAPNLAECDPTENLENCAPLTTVCEFSGGYWH